MRFEFIVPIRLQQTANHPEHWAKKANRQKKQSGAIGFLIKPQLHKINLPIKVQLVRVAPRSLDSDNLQFAFKFVRDFVSKLFFPELKIGRADDLDCFEWEYYQEKSKNKKYEIKIVIEEK